MTEIRFYHLLTQELGQALPQILGKALAGGKRVIVKTPSEKHSEDLNTLLWTYRADSFLPHGSSKDGFADDQPIWLTHLDENPNKADTLIMTDSASYEDISGFALCCEIFDGRDNDAVTTARARWKTYKDAGHDLTYWQQNQNGGWDKKS